MARVSSPMLLFCLRVNLSLLLILGRLSLYSSAQAASSSPFLCFHELDSKVAPCRKCRVHAPLERNRDRLLHFTIFGGFSDLMTDDGDASRDEHYEALLWRLHRSLRPLDRS